MHVQHGRKSNQNYSPMMHKNRYACANFLSTIADIVVAGRASVVVLGPILNSYATEQD